MITLCEIMCLEVSVNGSDQTAQPVFQGDQVFNIVKVIVLPRQHRLADSMFCWVVSHTDVTSSLIMWHELFMGFWHVILLEYKTYILYHVLSKAYYIYESSLLKNVKVKYTCTEQQLCLLFHVVVNLCLLH